MKKSKPAELDSSSWIVSYVDFMTVIMAFFITFTLIATKVAAATDLYIVQSMFKIERKLKQNLSKEYTIQNMGYSGVRIILPSKINGISMFNSNNQYINKSYQPYLDTLAQIIIDSTAFYSSFKSFKPYFNERGRDLNLNLRVEGHTDASGNINNNMILSLKRAEQTKDYLVNNLNFQENDFSICGYGETRPLNNISSLNENRRVELILNYTLSGIDSSAISSDTIQVVAQNTL